MFGMLPGGRRGRGGGGGGGARGGGGVGGALQALVAATLRAAGGIAMPAPRPEVFAAMAGALHMPAPMLAMLESAAADVEAVRGAQMVAAQLHARVASGGGGGAGPGPGGLAVLPMAMLMTDRDFNDADYEALLGLDDAVGQRGLDARAIARLPTLTLPSGCGPHTAPDGETRCPICVEDYKAKDVLRRTPCLHSYHRACLDEWLARKPTCPVCISKVAP